MMIIFEVQEDNSRRAGRTARSILESLETERCLRSRAVLGWANGLGLDPDALLEEDGSPSQSPTRAGGKSGGLILTLLFPTALLSWTSSPSAYFIPLYSPHNWQKSIQTYK